MSSGDQTHPEPASADPSGNQPPMNSPAVETPAADTPVADSPTAEASATEAEASATEAEASATDSGTAPSQQVSKAPVLGRGGGPLAARGLGVAKPASPVVSPEKIAEQAQQQPAKKPRAKTRPSGVDASKPATPVKTTPKVAVPNVRQGLAADVQAELDATLADADIEAMLSGPAGMPDRKEPLEDGARVQGQVLKIHDDSVFVSLGGPDQGVVPFEQFTDAEPVPGQSIEVLVRGINAQDGLYVLSLPGQAIEVTDFSDLEEGTVVEVTITGHNAGGLECKVGGVRGFIPISQVTEYRVEDLSEFVDQRFICLVTEANERRGNLVLSRRAILEREREEKRREQLEQIEPGVILEGIVPQRQRLWCLCRFGRVRWFDPCQ